ncbi:unnamed protein product [Rotaria sp. Silwood1]|nr:unnamed protein product [Rotaria sp. Silwood1]
MCDDLMRKLMKKLNMLIPEWELHRRINITIKQQIVSIIGLDLNQDYAYTLFSTVRILVKQNTQTIYDSKLIKEAFPKNSQIRGEKIANSNQRSKFII